MDVKEIECGNLDCINVVWIKDHCLAVVSKVMNF